jgi:hypothetical protein
MVYVFKTSVNTKRKAECVRVHIENLIECKSNFDLIDCDKILRLEADFVEVSLINSLMKSLGFECQELK